MDLQVALWIGGVFVVLLGGLCGVVGYLLSRDSTRRDRRDERGEEEFSRTKDRLHSKQGAQGENLADIRARLERLTHDTAKCDDLDRDVAVLKDFKGRAEARFELFAETERAVVALTEQNKTIFKRLDGLDEKMDDMPRATAAELRTMIRPVQRAS